MRVFAALMGLFLVLSALVYAPRAKTDLGSLLPVETLCVTRERGRVVVSGREVRGEGRDWASAMENLEATASGAVFLETADRLIVAENAADCLPAICRDERLRPAVQLYWLRGRGGAALEDFTAAHESPATLAEPEEIPVILEEHGRYRLG